MKQAAVASCNTHHERTNSWKGDESIMFRWST